MSTYAMLEISSGATEEEVRRAYRAMAKKWHPDRKLDDQETATKKFMEIDAAYRAILHDRRREARKHLSSSSSSKQTSSSHAPSDNNGYHSTHSKTKTTGFEQPDSLCYDSGNSRVENVDLFRDESGRRDKKQSSSPDEGKNKSSSRPSTASSDSSTFSTLASSSSSSMDFTKSSKKDRQTNNCPSTEAQKKGKQEIGHVSSPGHSVPPPPPAFMSSTASSEVSAYGNPEITLPPRVSAVHDARMNEAEIVPASEVATDNSITTPSAQPTEEKETNTPRAGTDPERSREKMHYSNKPRRSSSKKNHDHDHEERTLIPEFDSPLARSVGVSNQWTYTIPLTLTDLFHGKKLRFRVLRCKLSGKRKTILLSISIPPGSMHGTQVIFKSAGHENPDGSRQDIHFIIEEEKHEKFKRVGNDLVLDVRLPWSEGLKREKGVVNVTGLLDGSERTFEVDFVGGGNVVGEERIEGAGMPVFGTERRGCLVVRWEIFMPEPKTKWEALKQVLRL